VRDVRDLNTLQLDALKEVANIGGGHAATALAQLISRKTMVSVPQVRVTLLDDVSSTIGSPETIVAGILFHVLGDVTGHILILFPRDSAMTLADILLHRKSGETRVFSEIEQSSLKEAGNILTGSYLSVLSDFLGILLLPSIPSMVVDMVGAILTSVSIASSPDEEYVFCIETEFRFLDEKKLIRGLFLLLPDIESLSIILRALRVDT